MSRWGKSAIAGTSSALLALLICSVTAQCSIPVGVPRSQRLGALDPSDTRPQTFVFRQPERFAGISLVSAELGGDANEMPAELPRAFRVRIMDGPKEVATQDVLASSLTASNWHAPRRSCILLPEATLQVGTSYTLELISLDPRDDLAQLQVVLEFIDHGV